MWHELVLHGIGGRTIAEAKERLSYAEALDWYEYIARRGSLNWGTRLEGGFALLAYFIANKVSGFDSRGKPVGQLKKAGGQPFEMADFMPHAEKEEEDIDSKIMKYFGVQR